MISKRGKTGATVGGKGVRRQSKEEGGLGGGEGGVLIRNKGTDGLVLVEKNKEIWRWKTGVEGLRTRECKPPRKGEEPWGWSTEKKE